MLVNVGLSGSGQLYPLFIGALRCLSDRGFKIAEISATSGGAIIAASLASGYNPSTTMTDLIKRTLPLRNGLFDPSIFTFLWRWGFIKGTKIEEVFEKTFCKTLGESKLPVHIVTANVDKKKKRIFSSSGDPGFSVAKAVRASISIPILFAPVVIDGDKYVDGGTVKNFPVDVFTNGLPTIGFRIMSCSSAFKKIKDLFSYLFALLELMIDGNEEESIDDADNEDVITLHTKYNSLNFFVAEPDVDVMIQEGYQATAKWLDKHQHLLLEQNNDLST